MSDTLDDLLEYLDQLRARAPLPDLLDRVQRLRIDETEVAEFVRFSDDDYIGNLLQVGPWYQVFIFCWKNGQRSPVHDHAATTCAVRVLRGVATETFFEPAADGRMKRSHARQLGPGDISGRQDLDIHEIANLQPGDADLVTLHIYSPPMGEVGIFSCDEMTNGQLSPSTAEIPRTNNCCRAARPMPPGGTAR